MTFRADPFQVREYARKLGDVERIAEASRSKACPNVSRFAAIGVAPC